MNEQAILREHKLNDGHVLQIFHDSWAESPRSWDNLGTMAIFHKRYNFGDEVTFSAENFDNFEEMEGFINKELDAVVCLPIYMYDHSGITINTTGFACPWDSGQVGFIYVTNKKMIENYGENYDKEHIAKANKVLISEVKTMNQYIQGDVYGFYIVKDGQVIDSCSGFYGENFKENGMMDYINKDLLIDEL